MRSMWNGQTEQTFPTYMPLQSQHAQRGGFIEASGDTLRTGLGKFTDMCGLKLAPIHPPELLRSCLRLIARPEPAVRRSAHTRPRSSLGQERHTRNRIM